MRNNYEKNLVELVATNSTCYKYKVWAVLMKEWRTVSTWYNWVPSKVIECCEFSQIMLELWPYVKKHLVILLEFKKYKYSFLEHWVEQWYIDQEELKNVYQDLFWMYKVEILSINEKYLQNKDLLHFGFNMLLYLLCEWMTKEDYLSNCNVFHSDLSILWEVHAEENCIAFAAKNWTQTEGCDMYVTHLPCSRCARLIKQSWIKKVYYINEYVNRNWQETKDFFKINNIELIHFIE